MNILINLPPTFFTNLGLQDSFDRLRAMGTLTCTSHNTPEEIAPDLAEKDAIIMWSWPVLTEELFAKCPSLCYYGCIDATGTTSRAAWARKIPISCSRSGFSPAVAEMALALTLGLLRRTSDYHATMRNGTEKWVADFPSDIDPLERELTGASVGIVGLGAVGRRFAELLVPFRTTLRAHDPFAPNQVFEAAHAINSDVDTLFQNSDVIVLCAASNDGTKKLVNAERVAMMKPGSLLINVARAALVDYEALAHRMSEKKDIFAALDVFDTEPLPADSPLRSLPGTYLTPHRAGGLMASVRRNIDWLIEDFENVLEARPQKYPVTEAMLPGLDG